MTLVDLTKMLFTELKKSNAKISPAQAALIAAAANQIRTVIGQLDPASPLPAAEAAVFDLIATINGLGVSVPTANSLRGDAGDAGLALVDGNVNGACTSLQHVEDTANTNQLTPAQRAVLLPAVNAVRQPIGC